MNPFDSTPHLKIGGNGLEVSKKGNKIKDRVQGLISLQNLVTK